jgi:hypothetical protein
MTASATAAWPMLCHHMRHAADPEGYAAEETQGVEARSLTFKTGEGGSFAHLAHIARTAAAIAETGTNKPFDETPLLAKARELSVGRFIDFSSSIGSACASI